MNNMAKSYTVDELRKMGFAFTTNGDIVTPADMQNMAERYVMYEREKFKEEIIEALDDWVFDTFYEDEHDGDYDYGQPYIVCKLDTMTDLLNDLHNNMFNIIKK